MDLGMTELEAVINHWRARCPVNDHALALSAEVNVLAHLYARMIFQRLNAIPLNALDPGARQLIDAWRAQHPT